MFSICVSNTGDHLRNHGILLTNQGWKLPPAYDMNPNPFGNGLSLNISEFSHELSLELALEVSSDFRWERKKTERIVSKIKDEVSQWPTLVKQLKTSKTEQVQMPEAFRLYAKKHLAAHQAVSNEVSPPKK